MPADPEYAGRIRTAQISGIVRLTPLAMIASCLNATILLLTLGLAGSLNTSLMVWSLVVFALALYYARAWLKRRPRDPARQASRRAMRRSVLHGALFGALWGAVPVMTFPDAALPIQLLIGCLSAGMMCAGGFVLATVPLAGWSYVGMILAGATYALLAAGTTPIHVGLVALLVVYAAVVITNLTWNAHLFVDHFLAEARLQREVSARERAQAQVAHAQRMTALGELAGGIAHDFNNILQVVDGNATLIADAAEDTALVRELAAMIAEASERGSSISRRLLAFARQDTLRPEPLDAETLFANTAEFMKHALGAQVVIRIDVAPDLACLLADRAQLQSVLANLTSNARDAMPHGGVLTFRAVSEPMEVDRDHPPLVAGSYIRISVNDTGMGMDAATLERAAEPFFTTKSKGRGTGLGLPMAKGFAEQSGGGFAITSAPAQGTTVDLWLPQTERAVTADPPRPPASPRAWDPMRQRHVLVVDDDGAVRETVIRSLANAGFVVEGAEDGPRALEYLDRGATVDALVTDFSMVGINGIELIHAVHARRPGLAAILLTGHVGDVDPMDADAGTGGDGQFVLLRKPVAAGQLIDCILASLEGDAVS